MNIPAHFILLITLLVSSGKSTQLTYSTNSFPSVQLIPTEKLLFNSFVDCNMAEAWIGNTFRIFPGKYGEDPVWGSARDLKYADGQTVNEAFTSKPSQFKTPGLPENVSPGRKGLHGAIWFETVYQDSKDRSGKTLFALYHNENYPSTLPFDSSTGKGYINASWPEGLRGPSSAAAVCRIGLMRSMDGGESWQDKGIILEDDQPRMILKPHNTSKTFAGGVGDPSAIASGDYLYIFYGEYGYPGSYNDKTYNPDLERTGQCITIARILLKDLDDPAGKAKRWDGKGFNAIWNGIGQPVRNLQIPKSKGGGPASFPSSKFYWGPSVSWNTYLNCWVMLMAKAEGPSWQGNSIYISFNQNKDLGKADNSQKWSKPELLVKKHDHTLWYPSLQPLNTEESKREKYTSLKLGQEARLFFKDIQKDTSEYSSTFKVRFQKNSH